MNEHKRLPTLSLSMVEVIQRPESDRRIDLNSPAQEILTDFKYTQPFMIEQSTSLAIAREMMKRAHVRLKLVIDREERFRGLISLSDLLSVKVMQAAKKTGLGVDELTVADIMTSRSDLHAIDYRQIEHATIGDVLVTMKTFGDQHVLVVDSRKNCIRGIVSSSDIARTLQVAVDISERACSFAQIYQAVRG